MSNADERRPILVVEDDALVRRSVCAALEDEGLLVVAAADGQAALRVAALQPPALVVLDITLPILNGYLVADALRETHGSDLPILVMSADGRVREKARRVGAFAHLHKPFDLEDLVRGVRQGLDLPH